MTSISLKKQAVLLAGCTLLAGGLGLMCAQSAQAATLDAGDGACVKAVKKADTAVTKFDYDADGTADAVSYTLKAKGEQYVKMTLKIGTASKAIISGSAFYKPTVYLMQMDNGQSFVYVLAQSDGDNIVCSKVYKLKKGKIVATLNLMGSDARFGNKVAAHEYAAIEAVNGNKIKVGHSAQPYACGFIDYDYAYKCSKKGVFTRTAQEVTAKVTFKNGKKTVSASPVTAKTTAYKTSAAKKNQTLSIPSGTSVKVVGVNLTSSKKLLKVKYTVNKVTTTAYIDVTKYTNTKKALFKYASFAS